MSDKFKKLLDDVDRQVGEIKSQQKIETAKESRIQKILHEQEAKLKVLKAEEERVVKKTKVQSKIMYGFIFGVGGLAVFIPMWKKDPTNFWFYIIVAIFYGGLYSMYLSSDR